MENEVSKIAATDLLVKRLEAAPEWLTTKEVSRRLPLSEEVLNRWRSNEHPDGPPFFRFARQVRYFRADLIAWVLSRRINFG